MANLADDPPAPDVGILNPGIRRDRTGIDAIGHGHGAIAKLGLDLLGQRGEAAVVADHQDGLCIACLKLPQSHLALQLKGIKVFPRKYVSRP